MIETKQAESMQVEGHEITRRARGEWLSAKCSCGQGSHASSRPAPITGWVNRHLKAAEAEAS